MPMRRPLSRRAGAQVPVTATTARCGAAPAVAAGAEPVRCRTRGSSSRTARPAHKARRLPPRRRGRAAAHRGPGADPAAQATLLVGTGCARLLTGRSGRGTPWSQPTRSVTVALLSVDEGQTPKLRNGYRLM